MNNNVDLMEKVVSLCKRRGFVFQGSEIYGGLANTWDLGPLGTELKNNIFQEWWKFFVHKRRDVVGIDAAIFMNPRVWEASGHVSNFNDAQIDCKQCKKRHRADHLIEDALHDIKVEGLSPEDLTKIIQENDIPCPDCGSKNFTDVRTFNLLFQTHIGPTAQDNEPVYLRGEIAQGMFVNFKNVLNTTRKKLPFGIASAGKAFRNEITPGNFIFRTLEFDLMEFEYFVPEDQWKKKYDYWLEEMNKWLDVVGISRKNTRVREHTQDELSHYSKRTVDIEYNTPFGWKELYGLAYRTDFDLRNHMEKSGQDLTYFDQQSGEKFIPHVIEPTFGLSRTLLMVLLDAYTEEEIEDAKGNKETRTVLRFKPAVAPFKAAVLPLMKKPELLKKSEEVFDMLNDTIVLDYDSTGSIGKRYRRHDEIGTPYAITIDFDTLEDNAVTVRDRDTTKQERISLDTLADYMAEKLSQ
ncbi:glycine--tRNA ligase [Candidatus Peregrinibacteria bacterium]|nr:glycine--tRNA ligase [Candidatus Peregrinibacteria bacterium]